MVDTMFKILKLYEISLDSIIILSFLTLSQGKISMVEATWFEHTSKWQLLRTLEIMKNIIAKKQSFKASMLFLCLHYPYNKL